MECLDLESTLHQMYKKLRHMALLFSRPKWIQDMLQKSIDKAIHNKSNGLQMDTTVLGFREIAEWFLLVLRSNVLEIRLACK